MPLGRCRDSVGGAAACSRTARRCSFLPPNLAARPRPFNTTLSLATDEQVADSGVARGVSGCAARTAGIQSSVQPQEVHAVSALRLPVQELLAAGRPSVGIRLFCIVFGHQPELGIYNLLGP